jgi:hypothetical protein
MTEEYKNAKIFEFRQYIAKEYGVNYRLPDVRYGIPNDSDVDKWRAENGKTEL